MTGDDTRGVGRKPMQILIINITRMGDLVQTGVLLDRLQQESPGAAIDVLVDCAFAPMATLLKGVRRVLAFDFHNLLDETRVKAKDVVTLHSELKVWARPLADAGYDRVVNLTFNRRSAWLVAYIRARDIRGVGISEDGALTVRNPWMAYFTDLHRHRRYNRFNLVDLYALGGAGPGPAASLCLAVTAEARAWARDLLQHAAERQPARGWMAVQVGASDVIKAWRPEYFGATMAALQRKLAIGFVMIGTNSEAPAVHRALDIHRATMANAGLTVGPVCDAVGRTDLPQLLGLLSGCRLLLTNDTGPMHMATAVGTPVVDLSVGHVDFRETGPYGAGHWVFQPVMDCAPCGFDMVCPHHACKDRLVPEDIASLCLHALGEGPLPSPLVGGARLYESVMDEDGLVDYRIRGGAEDPIARWYGAFWRRYWYHAFTGVESRAAQEEGPAPNAADVRERMRRLAPGLHEMCGRADEIARLSRRLPIPVGALSSAQQALTADLQSLIRAAQDCPACWPPVVALLREIHSLDGIGLTAMARQQARAYHQCTQRLTEVAAATNRRMHDSFVCVSR